ncbi:hypothetical protein [Nocardia nova]|uniref:hypothetical protein n=1 Tax=Nocardia nova TaxID=37330 RepID=UPI0027386B0B|nr:hypothetical protein [Nocardia nova]
MTTQIALLSALRAPYEHQPAVSAVIRCLGEVQPAEVVIVGDVLAEEANDWDAAVTRFFEPLRQVYDGPVGIHLHDPETLPRGGFDLSRFGVRVLPELYEVAPGWVTSDGKDSRIQPSEVAGNTAVTAARKIGSNVVLACTDRMGLGHYTITNKRSWSGFEVGNLMDAKRAGRAKEYRENGAQLGFGMLTVDGDEVQAVPVPITRDSFEVAGQIWKL